MVELLDTLQIALGEAYRIERELPAGGMSRLVLATETSAFDRRVVIKVLPPDMVSPQATARFRREVDVTAHLQHPHILAVLGAGAREGLLYYIMPYIEGESLRRRLERGERYSLASALRLLREVADGLAYAHGRGVIHRDIKPENILLADEHALVADFGIARGAMTPTAGETTATVTGVSVGTLGYMAPEQLFPSGPVDARCDIYSLGVVAYELVAGAPPFTATSAPALASAHLNEVPKPLHEVAPSVPRAVSDAIAKALAKDPNDRQQQIAELRDTFEAALSLLHTGSIIPPVVETPRRRLGLWAAAAVGAVALLATAAYTLTRPGGGGPAADENRIAVVPFNLPQGADFVAWGGAELWSSTLLNVATRQLDGMGPLTTVDAATVSREWKGKADGGSARALAIDHNAGLAVWGDIARGARDTIIARAQILNVVNGKTLGEVEVRGEEGRPHLLAASLSLAVLDKLKEWRAITATPNAGLGSREIAAVKEFTQGEGFYRASQWDSALVHYQAAIAADSNFALAYRRAGQSTAWLRSTDDDQSRTYLRRAGALNRNLGRHDSLLIAADSLGSTLPDDSDPRWLPQVRRLLGLWNRAVTLYPSDAEVWFGRGDAAYHYGYGPGVGVVDRDVLRDFSRAVELNRGFAPAYEHAVELALAANLPDSARKYAEAFLALTPEPGDAPIVRLTKQIVDYATSQSAELDVLLDTANAEQLANAWSIMRRWPDAQETALRVARTLERRDARDALFSDPRIRTSLQLAYRGHVREAGRILASLGVRDALFVDYALVGAFTPAEADSMFRRWLNDYAPARQEFPWWTLPWWAERGDSTAIRRIAQETSRQAQTGDSAQRRTAVYAAAAAQGYARLVSGDSSGALSALRVLPDSLCVGCYLDRLRTAQLLAASGEAAKAALLLDERPNRLLTPAEIPIALERARVASRLESDQRARDAYALVANAWSRADSALAPLVAEARERMTALRRKLGGDSSSM